MPRSPDDVFDELIRTRNLISYKRAHEELVGTGCSPWRQRVHNREVVGKAITSSERVVGGLRVHLDALIVAMKTGEPGNSHFTGKSYDLAGWRRVFGGWALRQ